MLKEIKKEVAGIVVTRKTVRDFCLLFTGILAAAAGWLFWKGQHGWPWPAGGAAAFLAAGAFAPLAVAPLYRAWMTLAAFMGYVMTRVILVGAFSLVMTPLAVLLRMMGKDLIDKKRDAGAASYWKGHASPADKDRYKKQF